MNSTIKNKRILLFTQKFFDYSTIVCDEMKRQGAIVHFYDERANVNSIEKIIIKLVPFFIRLKISRYYKKICSQEYSFSPDYVLFITTTIVSKKDIQRMRIVFPKACFILHLWDSVKNTNAKHIYKLFDRCLSFDFVDCRKYNFIFRPNFFVPSEIPIVKKTNYKYDFAFIGTIHSDRAKILYKLGKIFEKEGYNYFFYFFVPGKLMLILRFVFNKYFRKLDKANIHTKVLPRNECNKILDDVLYLIDINHPKQNGLTMRPFDMLYAKRKIFTVDASIKQYDFYRPENQLLFDRKTLAFNREEFSNIYTDIPDDILNEYSIENWINDLFFLQKEEKAFLI